MAIEEHSVFSAACDVCQGEVEWEETTKLWPDEELLRGDLLRDGWRINADGTLECPSCSRHERSRDRRGEDA